MDTKDIDEARRKWEFAKQLEDPFTRVKAIVAMQPESTWQAIPREDMAWLLEQIERFDDRIANALWEQSMGEDL